MIHKPSVGVVVIGRNEGDRLAQCLRSVPANIERVVYVDSGSTDNSTALAAEAGATVIALDMSVPFTAARARNTGFQALCESGDPTLVQFIDGDCEFDPDWFSTAENFLSTHPKAAVVCGRRRERFPYATVYNRLCDWEWNTPVGPTKACGGDAMMRADVFKQVDGFRDTMIAGEEPELCVRIRAQGWEVWRLDAEMTLHDAAMTRFNQWWKRTRRSGHAFAEGAALHGAPPERHSASAVQRILKWGLFAPIAILLLAATITPWALLLAAIYPLQVSRLALREGAGHRTSWERGFFLTLGNFAEAQGILEYYWRRFRGGEIKIIEYK